MVNVMKRLLLLLFSFLPALAFAQGAPDELVRNTTDEVVAIVKAHPEMRNGRSAKVDALVEAKVLPHFDFAEMTRMAVARNWDKATPEQQSQLVKEFKTLLVNTYAASISSVSQYKISVTPLTVAPGDNDVVVNTVVTRPGTAAVNIDYSMKKEASGWMVHDIKVDGVSLVINYRGNFNSEVRRSGIDGLIQVLQKRNQQLGG